MKMSEMLVEGAKHLPKQIAGYPFGSSFHNRCSGGCAIGAIAIGSGYNHLKKDGTLRKNASDRAYIIVDKLLVNSNLRSADIYRNNDAGWSFKKIAAWLRRKGL